LSKALPPLTWFRSFEAAARTLNFTAAAEEIGLTQSAVSQQVKSLELRLGAPLFVRLPRGLSLTDDGRKLLPQVGAALDTLARAARTFDPEPTTNLLTIATSVSVAQWVIAPHLPDFTAKYPTCRVRILSAIWPDDFNTARADVEIRFGSAKQVGRDAKALLPNRLIALKSASHRSELSELPLIETVGTSVGWQAWQDSFGLLKRPVIYTDTYGMALQMASHGNGVALVSELLAGHALATGRVLRAHPEWVAGQEGYFLSLNEALPAAQAFGDWLQEKLATKTPT